MTVTWLAQIGASGLKDGDLIFVRVLRPAAQARVSGAGGGAGALDFSNLLPAMGSSLTLSPSAIPTGISWQDVPVRDTHTHSNTPIVVVISGAGTL